MTEIATSAPMALYPVAASSSGSSRRALSADRQQSSTQLLRINQCPTAGCDSVLSHGFRRQDDSGRHNSSLARSFPTD
jgi:hypothetical protein